MSVYKDLEKRKLYQKIWAREKVLKKRAIEIVPESVVESVVESECIDCFYPNRIRGKCLIILD